MTGAHGVNVVEAAEKEYRIDIEIARMKAYEINVLVKKESIVCALQLHLLKYAVSFKRTYLFNSFPYIIYTPHISYIHISYIHINIFPEFCHRWK